MITTNRLGEIEWNPWIGCHKCSAGCESCRARDYVTRNRYDFRAPIQRTRKKITKHKIEKYEMQYRIGAGTVINVCTNSDFFIEDADPMREEAWQIIHDRPDCLFHIITRRPERISQCLPKNWLGGWENILISINIDCNISGYIKLPYLNDIYALGFKHIGIAMKPLLEGLDNEILSYIGSGFVENVRVYGDSYYGYDKLSTVLDISWVKDINKYCELLDIPMQFVQTGSRFKDINGRISGVRVGDQFGLADFLRLNVERDNGLLNEWVSSSDYIEKRILAEDAHSIYQKIINSNFLKV